MFTISDLVVLRYYYENEGILEESEVLALIREEKKFSEENLTKGTTWWKALQTEKAETKEQVYEQLAKMRSVKGVEDVFEILSRITAHLNPEQLDLPVNTH